ncbi:sensor domain-containing diguanylate cyclase [Lysinibacillus sp. 54212]|uniref:sensor domain-containing diguanylate cyclase n=1 Tax=Lysinibacillus sp. 54212 TaxID=3119829 RepID=UPI002FC69248
MNEHQRIITNIKSDILNLCVNLEDSSSFNEYFNSFLHSLQQHFDITKSCFLVYELDILKPLMTDVAQRNFTGIPWSLVETYFAAEKVVDVPYFLNEKQEFKDMTHMMLVRVGKKSPAGILLFQQTNKWLDFSKSEYTEDLVDVFSKASTLMMENQEVRLNDSQYRKLYNMTELFHSTMDIDLILQNVLFTIRENFPDLDVELILSNDQDRQTTIDIKPFDYLSERPSTIEAFVSGDITTELAADLDRHLLNAPIKGRQAIYGILQVSAPKTFTFTSTQKEFIRMLAQASGNALENAKLYHQSHRLISDLQLINETSHRLNMKLNIDEMLLFLQKQLMKSFQPMEMCFVFKVEDYYKLTDSSTELFKTLDGRIYIDHVQKHFEHTQDSLFIADFSRLLAEDVKYKSMMAIPMIVEESINGFSIVLHRDPYFFSFDSFKLMQSLIQHSSLAISNSILRNRLQDMVDRDHLTKLFARSYLDSFVEKSLQNDDSGMFMLMDIDNFKRVNDTYGHQVGDEVLVQIGAQLQGSIGTRGICARWGGEELAVYIPNILDNEAYKIAGQIVSDIPKVTNPKVTISAGLITWHRAQRPEFQTVFLHADTALYNAKNNGKNQVCMFDESMQLQP